MRGSDARTVDTIRSSSPARKPFESDRRKKSLPPNVPNRRGPLRAGGDGASPAHQSGTSRARQQNPLHRPAPRPGEDRDGDVRAENNATELQEERRQLHRRHLRTPAGTRELSRIQTPPGRGSGLADGGAKRRNPARTSRRPLIPDQLQPPSATPTISRSSPIIINRIRPSPEGLSNESSAASLRVETGLIRTSL